MSTSSSGCPVGARTAKGDGDGSVGGSALPSGCPLHAAAVSPLNNMPAPNQQQAAGQRLPLSTERVASTIPSKSADGGVWSYPSAQMFFNAMRRKGYAPKEEEMRTVVAIHNTVNERTWQEVQKWEAMYPECLETLKLVRFGGKPDEPTLKARIYTLMGYKPPFDRHDWVVERCGKEVYTYLSLTRTPPPYVRPHLPYISPDAFPQRHTLSISQCVHMPHAILFVRVGLSPSHALPIYVEYIYMSNPASFSRRGPNRPLKFLNAGHVSRRLLQRTRDGRQARGDAHRREARNG